MWWLEPNPDLLCKCNLFIRRRNGTKQSSPTGADGWRCRLTYGICLKKVGARQGTKLLWRQIQFLQTTWVTVPRPLPFRVGGVFEFFLSLYTLIGRKGKRNQEVFSTTQGTYKVVLYQFFLIWKPMSRSVHLVRTLVGFRVFFVLSSLTWHFLFC